MRRRLAASVLLSVLALFALPACGTARQNQGERAARLGLERIGSFDNPTYIAGAPGFPKLLFVVEQPGRVEVLRGGRRLNHPFLDISGLVDFGGERGLLSIAFPPDYKQSGDFYVYYTDKAGNIRVDEFQRAAATRAKRDSRRNVIEIPHPINDNHNGGQLQFSGNLLYLGTGDGGAGGDPPNNAQNKESLLGKLLRIDPRPGGGKPYSVPADNPFVGKPGRDEIYSYGLRNPFRFSFDTTTAAQPRIAIGDVGQNRFEELDYMTLAGASGANFGWDAFEGFHPYEEEDSGTPDPGGTTKPIMAYSHDRDGGSCTIIGGYVVGPGGPAALRGRYLYADYCSGIVRSLLPHLHRASDDRKTGLTVSSPTSFGEDDLGRIYVASQEGPVYRLTGR
ncbi:MAG TPA: PQQ-dependent sugar dehydrogenase [Solirubrobacterales bacterium]|jgi:glucose/arabinose dehydrogenase|nr:PQQ-dependent sugar dehydrogenase [Solirubrobacterales bacterium]